MLVLPTQNNMIYFYVIFVAHKTNIAIASFFFLKDFIYLFMRDTERKRQRHKQREK